MDVRRVMTRVLVRTLGTLAFLALVIGAYYQETGGDVERLPAAIRPAVLAVQAPLERVAGWLKRRAEPLAAYLRLPQQKARAEEVAAGLPQETAARPQRQAAAKPPAAGEVFAPGEWVTGKGVVTELLPEDRTGERHQLFRLRLADGRTVKVAHNTSRSRPLRSLKVGDTVEYRGRYERGGILHFTHRASGGGSSGGWLRHQGVRYD